MTTRRRVGTVPGSTLAAVAVGGALGATGRYGAGVAWPTPDGGFPWSTFGVNIVGCFAIGLLFVALTEGAGPPHPLARPFLGTGLLGGFTTFSAYAVEADLLVAQGRAAVALGYVFGTLAAAVLAAQAGVWSARAAARAARRRRSR